MEKIKIVERAECNRCGQVVDNVDSIKARHELGRHTRHKTQNERYLDAPKEINGGLGGLDYGEVVWIIHK